MSRSPFLWLSLFAGSLAGAADEPAADPFAAVRRELDALKQNVPVTDQVRVAVPQIDAPALQTPSTATPLIAIPSAFGQARKTRNANSPFDPMRKDRAKLSDDSLLFDERQTEHLMSEPELDDRAQEDEREPRVERSERETPAPNPLDGFMASWMTPADYSLLAKRAPADAFLPETRETRTFDPRVIDTTNAVSPGAPWGWGNVPVSTAPTPSAPNPYLTIALEPLPPLPAPRAAAAPPPEPTPLRAPAPATRTSTALPKSSLPTDVQKRDENAKHFPQLKNF